jgi:hypothetical protein
MTGRHLLLEHHAEVRAKVNAFLHDNARNQQSYDDHESPAGNGVM